MKRRYILTLAITWALFGVVSAYAQYERNGYYMSANCAAQVPATGLSPSSSMKGLCWDTTKKAFFGWNGTVWTQYYGVPTATPTATPTPTATTTATPTATPT